MKSLQEALGAVALLAGVPTRAWQGGALAVLLLAGSAASADPSKGVGFSLIDAAGNRAGVMFPVPLVSGGSVAVLSVDGLLVGVRVEGLNVAGSIDAERIQFSRSSSGRFFLTSDCSGPPYIRRAGWRDGTRPVETQVLGADVWLYVAQRGFDAVQTYQSISNNNQCVSQSGTVRAWPLERVINLTSRFPEPLRIVLDR